jgi:antibiotic biosynthesis monooxygenase (ABM) superfamily enzyme
VLSVVVRRFGHESRDEVEDLAKRTHQAVSMQAGFLRLQNSLSSKGYGHELVTVYSFDTRENLEKWEKSPIRIDLVRELDRLTADELTHTKFDGLALLASPNARVRKLETVAVLIFWILVIGRLLGALADQTLPESFSPFWRDALIITINVLLISYLFLPWSSTLLTRLKARFPKFGKRK